MGKTSDNPADEVLLQLMLTGDGAAFARLYQRWQSSIYRFALRMSGSESIAEDVTQDVFLAVMRDGSLYEGRGTFASWILTIARHSTLRRLKRERRFVALEADQEADEPDTVHPDNHMVSTADPLAELAQNEKIEAVRQAVLGLPPHYREVVLLCHLHELSYAEAADVIGCEIGTVCSRLYRARSLLASRLDPLKSDSGEPSGMKFARNEL